MGLPGVTLVAGSTGAEVASRWWNAFGNPLTGATEPLAQLFMFTQRDDYYEIYGSSLDQLAGLLVQASVEIQGMLDQIGRFSAQIVAVRDQMTGLADEAVQLGEQHPDWAALNGDALAAKIARDRTAAEDLTTVLASLGQLRTSLIQSDEWLSELRRSPDGSPRSRGDLVSPETLVRLGSTYLTIADALSRVFLLGPPPEPPSQPAPSRGTGGLSQRYLDETQRDIDALPEAPDLDGDGDHGEDGEEPSPR
jgi:hypothetical protein